MSKFSRSSSSSSNDSFWSSLRGNFVGNMMFHTIFKPSSHTSYPPPMRSSEPTESTASILLLEPLEPLELIQPSEPISVHECSGLLADIGSCIRQHSDFDLSTCKIQMDKYRECMDKFKGY